MTKKKDWCDPRDHGAFARKPITARQAQAVIQWLDGSIRLSEALKVVRYRGAMSNGIRTLYTYLMRGIRSGQLVLKRGSRIPV